jgi:integrase
MPDDEARLLMARPRMPWSKGKLIEAKPPLRPKHVWSIRTRLMVEGRTRDLTMFNLAIDSRLRGCDVVALKVEDVALSGYTAERATVGRGNRSLRRTKATLIYRRAGNLRAVQLLLGHAKIESTVRYSRHRGRRRARERRTS